MKKEHFVLLSISFLFVSMAVFCVNTVISQHIEATTAELTDEAESIVRGTVKAMKSEWNNEKTFIWTFVTVTVTETIKGDTLEKDIIVKIPGGVVEEIAQRSEHDVVFKENEDVLLFLKKELYMEKEYLQVVRLFQGKFTIKDNEVIEKKLPVEAFKGEIKKAIEKKIVE